ncbi:Transient receptor potential cation channel trpm [Schistosoma japonicum]|uniref:Transient receptor potential cation channel trpm n=1 Tax=Schistosoma japonicum TaxID=6182 RepID=A0A4Z2DLL4_SCHJA|nr:Transient receptor potential cation channel trpm [Schistosoma japonicum]
MIRSMLEELISFIFILIVVFLAYGISLHVLLYPYRHEFTWNDVRDVLYYPYWNLYGELSLDYTFAATNSNCGSNPDGITCPIYHFFCPLFLAVYLMIAGTLLINLLIAIFSNVFEQIQYHSIELWKFNMFSMVVEFNKKPIVPVPLSAVQAFIELILHCIKMSKINKRNVKNYRFAASESIQPLVENEAEDEKDDGARLFKFTERNNRRPRLGSLVSFSQLTPRPSKSSLIDAAIPESLHLNLEHEGEDNDDAFRRVRVLEANCKRNFLRKKKLDRGKTIEAGIGQLKDRLEEIYSNLINVGEKVESLTRDIEFFNAANEIKSTERSSESTRKNVPSITDSQEPHSEKPTTLMNDQTSKQQPAEISKLSPIEYPEISSESEVEYTLDASEPPIDVLPIFDQFEKSHQTSSLQNILLNLKYKQQ